MPGPRYERPDPDEHLAYYRQYVEQVPEGDLLAQMDTQAADVATQLGAVGEEKGGFAYAPGKWTVKELVGHLIDGERVFTYRAMTFARGDTGPLPGFDENAWVPAGRFNERSLRSLVTEWLAVRQATRALYGGLPVEAHVARGSANGAPVTVRALAFITVGHVNHHLRILRERYLA